MSDSQSGSGGFGRRADTPRPIVPKTASEALRPEPGTPPPVRSRASRNQVVVFLNFVVSLIVFAVVAAGVVLFFGRQAFESPGPLTVAETFLVKPNSGVSEIAGQLERRGIISDARVFRLGLRAHGADGSLKAGEYEIKPQASMREVMELLHSGRSVLHSLTVPEGLTVHQVLQRVAEHEALAGDMPAEVPQEGELVADTQRFTRGMSRADIVAKMKAQQAALVEEVWARRVPDLPVKDINEFVTLASIVEKETGKGDERPRVAAVFINRLRQGMRLQSDPTILYGLFGGEGRPSGRPIYQSDIEKPTPYNTYVINGLPPGPIANPGRASLEAVANPSKTDELYFVADGTGGHAFARTLEEHNQNVARWRAIQRQQSDQSAQEGGD